jgi:P-type Cu+ transporter
VSEKTKKIVLNISGMTCINCAHTIEKALLKLNGVTQATVNLAAEKALIDYNPDVIDQHVIEDAVTTAGYKVIHDKVVLQVTGMSCVNCAKSIEKGLLNREGVYNAVVNFAAERVTVEYNTEQISLAAIKKTIKDTGYNVIENEQEKSAENTEDKERKRHVRRLKILLAASVILTIPIMAIMWLSPLPMEQNNLIMFLLATPVQFTLAPTRGYAIKL